jgi:hypothetical protein
LTPASGFASDGKSQYAGVGVELMMPGHGHSCAPATGQICATPTGTWSPPVWVFPPFNVVHLDLTGMVGTDRTYGAVAQLVYTF